LARLDKLLPSDFVHTTHQRVVAKSSAALGGDLMHIPAVILVILIGGVLFDLDAWGIALAVFFVGIFGPLIYGG
jgi:hypothetical protein